MFSDRRLTMKLLGFLNLEGISGQIAALVVASIVAIHLIITNLSDHRPDQIDPSIGHGHSQLAAAVQLLGAAPAAGRPGFPPISRERERRTRRTSSTTAWATICSGSVRSRRSTRTMPRIPCSGVELQPRR